MKRIVTWTSFAVAVYLVSLAITMPAGVAWQMVGDRTPAQLIAPAGTLFSGSAQALVWPDGARIDGVEWSFQPTGLLTGAAAVRVEGQLRDGSLAATFRYRPWRGLQARNVQLDTPLTDLLVVLRHQPAAEIVSGQLNADLAQVTMAGSRFAGARGVITWRDARAGFGAGFRFGDVTLRLEPKPGGEGATGEISSRGGDIAISGQLNLTADRRFELEARIGGEGSPNEATRRLRTFLGLAGDDNGRIAVTGNWRNKQLTLERVERN